MKNGGKIFYSFKNGVLTVGDPKTHTGAGNFAYYTQGATPADNMVELYADDLDGNAVSVIEMCGLGSLTGKSYTGATLTNKEDGYRGYFFESPILTSTTDVVSAVVGITYEVLSGTVIYKGVTYTKGQTFVTAGGTTATTGTGTFAVTFTADFGNLCDAFLDCQFKIKHLMRGDEMEDYFLWTEAGGFDPKDSLTCTDPGYYGWVE